MKKIITILVILCFSYSFGNAQEVKWKTWNEAYKLAQKENKEILVFVHTDWCHQCLRMDSKTYNNEEISKLVNDNFIPVKINPEEQDVAYQFEGNEYKPMDLLSKLSDGRCGGIPTTLFVNIKTNKTDMKVGFIVPDEFKKILDEHVL